MRSPHFPKFGHKALSINDFRPAGPNNQVPTRFGAERELNNKVLVSCPPWAKAGPPDRRYSPMPRYFFNTRIGNELILDPEGEELRDPDHAWNVARTTIREILKTEGEQANLLSAILEVTDDEGDIVMEFPFAEAIIDPSDETPTRH
jgi:hypothetical protein